MSEPPPLLPLSPLSPIPVLPVEYSVGQVRPGIITAVGIVSIVLASLGLLAGVVSGLYAVGFTIASAVTSRATSTATLTTSGRYSSSATVSIPDSESTPSASELSPMPRGLGPRARAPIVAGLASKHPFNTEKQDRLHELLAKGGQDMFPIASNGAPPASVIAADVSECAELPSAAGETEGPIYFIVGTGKIELYDDHAVFFPTGRGEPLRIARGVSIEEDDVEGAAVSGGSTGGTLTSKHVQAIVDQVQSMAGTRLNAAQVATLTRELQDPSQEQIATGPGTAPPVRQVVSVNMQPDGSVQVITRQGFMLINPSGQVVASNSFNAATAFSRFRIRASASVLTILTSAAGLALSIYLLVVGILTLRQRPSARRLHLVYAVLKIPVAIVGAVGWYLFIADLSQSFATMAAMGSASANASASATAAASTTGAMVWAIVMGVVACAYPIALLIVMNAPGVRAYYRVAVAPAQQ